MSTSGSAFPVTSTASSASATYWSFVRALSRTASPYVAYNGNRVCYHCAQIDGELHEPNCCWLDAFNLKLREGRS